MMLVCVDPVDILVINKWCVTNRISDDQGNTLKYQLLPISGYDYDTLPFVVSSGSKSINLINVKSTTIQPLVQASTDCYAGQSVAFFKAEEAGISLQYTTRTADDLNNIWHSWFSTVLHSDFIECIEKLGRLPPTNT